MMTPAIVLVGRGIGDISRLVASVVAGVVIRYDASVSERLRRLAGPWR